MDDTNPHMSRTYAQKTQQQTCILFGYVGQNPTRSDVQILNFLLKIYRSGSHRRTSPLSKSITFNTSNLCCRYNLTDKGEVNKMKCHLGRQKKQSTAVAQTEIEIFGCLALHPITLRTKEGNRTFDIGTCRPKDLLYLTIHVLENQFHSCTRLVYATFEIRVASVTKMTTRRAK